MSYEDVQFIVLLFLFSSDFSSSHLLNLNQAAQILGKPDLAPAAWVRRLVTLCDNAPATPFEVVRLVLEEELGRNVAEVFERFDVDPVGSASIAQVPFTKPTCFQLYIILPCYSFRFWSIIIGI